MISRNILQLSFAFLFFGLILFGINYLQENPQVLDNMETATGNVIKDVKQTMEEQKPAIANIKKAVVETVSLKPDIDIQQLEHYIHKLVNRERKKFEYPSLSYDADLERVARAHSQDMVNRNFFSHDNPSGEDPTARGRRQSVHCTKDYGSYYTTGIAENIAQDNLYTSVTYTPAPIYDWQTPEEIASSIVNGWMNSKGHRENILNSQYDEEGIGIAIGPDHKVFATQNFC